MNLDDLREMNPFALLADGLEPALVGMTLNVHHESVAVYDYALCIETLMDRDGMSYEDADEFLAFNTLSAYVGPHGPLYIAYFDQDDDEEFDEWEMPDTSTSSPRFAAGSAHGAAGSGRGRSFRRMASRRMYLGARAAGRLRGRRFRSPWAYRARWFNDN